MTTIVIDCEKQTVFTDSCTTVNKYFMCRKTVLGYFLTSDKYHTYNVERCVTDKIESKGDVVITGTGDKDLIDRFKRMYGKDIPCEIQKDENAVIYVVSKRDVGLLIDKYTVKRLNRLWYKKPAWEIETFVKTTGFITDGSGGDYAAGAMMIEHDGRKAIKAASLLCPYTDGNVNEVKL